MLQKLLLFNTYYRFLKFVFVGLFCLITYSSLSYLFNFFMDYKYAVSIAYIINIFIHYFLNQNFTFLKKFKYIYLIKYFLLLFIHYLLNLILIFMFKEYVKVNLFLSVSFSSLILSILTYLFLSNIVFYEKK